MKTQLLLSIIIPVYNGEKYIRSLVDCINSINKDIIDKIEIILIDDGSKDESAEICYDMSINHSNVIYIHKENGGIASARNAGLKVANGSYVTFCDQDDILINSYDDFIKKLEETKADILISDPCYFRNGIVVKQNRISKDELCLKDKIKSIILYYIGGKKMPIETNLTQSHHLPHSIWNSIFNRDLIVKNDINFFSIVDYEDDWRFTTTCALHANSIVLCKNSFYAWFINPVSESHSHKYINHFLRRRQAAVKWNIDALKSMNIDANLLKRQQLLEDKRTVIWGFYNACALPEIKCINELKCILKECEHTFYLIFYGETLVERFYLILMSLRLFKLVYYVNIKFLKRIYH